MQTYKFAILLPDMLMHYITLKAYQMNILNISSRNSTDIEASKHISTYTCLWSGDNNDAMTLLQLHQLMHKNDKFFIKINFFHSNLYFDS